MGRAGRRDTRPDSPSSRRARAGLTWPHPQRPDSGRAGLTAAGLPPSDRLRRVVTPPVRFRFAEFVLSPRRRLLLRDGAPVALIPKYLDLLLLLVVRRQDAVSKQAIFDQVWSDVIVSDGALSQAVRTLRRTLGDDSRDPRFIRTVSRHGYQFIWAEVVEED